MTVERFKEDFESEMWPTNHIAPFSDDEKLLTLTRGTEDEDISRGPNIRGR